jgi:hypothetical protein
MVVFSCASPNKVLARIDTDKHRSVGQRFDVQGFPTLKVRFVRYSLKQFLIVPSVLTEGLPTWSGTGIHGKA